MDEFLRDINTTFYYYWILEHNYSGIEMKKEEQSIVLSDQCSKGYIIFYSQNIIEQQIIDIKTNETVFYIHFQMSNMAHAVGLFQEMIDCFYENASQPFAKVLLCCSGGLTTTLFAQRMMEVAKMKKENCQVDATGFANLYSAGKDYDLILLAPQISYALPTARKNLAHVKVDLIPTKFFATNNYYQTFEYAMTLLKEVVA